MPKRSIRQHQIRLLMMCTWFALCYSLAHVVAAVCFVCSKGKCNDAWKFRSGCVCGGDASWRDWCMPRLSARLCGCMSWGAKSELLVSMAFCSRSCLLSQGWIPTQTSSACEALDSDYTGPCPMELFVKEMTANEKANMEIRWEAPMLNVVCDSYWFCTDRCSVCWPCKQDVAGEPVSGVSCCVLCAGARHSGFRLRRMAQSILQVAK
jgi:hypothetical protein